MKRVRSGNDGAVSSGHVEISLMKRRRGAQARPHAESREFPFGEAVQLGIECSEERFCCSTLASFDRFNQR